MVSVFELTLSVAFRSEFRKEKLEKQPSPDAAIDGNGVVTPWYSVSIVNFEHVIAGGAEFTSPELAIQSMFAFVL